jgi:hypothetical protein
MRGKTNQMVFPSEVSATKTPVIFSMEQEAIPGDCFLSRSAIADQAQYFSCHK